MTKLTNRTLHLFLSPPTVTWSNPFCLLFSSLAENLVPNHHGDLGIPPTASAPARLRGRQRFGTDPSLAGNATVVLVMVGCRIEQNDRPHGFRVELPLPTPVF